MIQITAQVGDHLRWEEDGAHGGYEEDLGLHQEEQPQSGPSKLEWICSNFTRVLTCKIWLRYSRERASQSMPTISQKVEKKLEQT